MTNILILMYRVMERIDGEKGIKIVEYKIAQKIKLMLLRGIK